MRRKRPAPFDVKTFLTTIGVGRAPVQCRKGERIFVQGTPADAVFFIQSGRVKLTVVSSRGKAAIVGILGASDFLGEGCLAGQPVRIATASAITDVVLMRIGKAAMVEVLHQYPALAERFIVHLLSRHIRFEEDLIDQLFNSSEKRLARILLLLAHFGKDGNKEAVAVQKLSQETLAEVGGHHAVPGELVHEQVPEAGLHRVQRRATRAQFALERRLERLAVVDRAPRGPPPSFGVSLIERLRFTAPYAFT